MRSLVRFFCFLAKYWSYNWASLAANTCSRLKQGWWVKISPEISISNWNIPWKSPGPTKYWLVDVIFIAWKKKRIKWIYRFWKQYLSRIFFVRKWHLALPTFKCWVLNCVNLFLYWQVGGTKPPWIFYTTGFYSPCEAETRSPLPILKVLPSNEDNDTGLEKAKPPRSLLTHLFGIALFPLRAEL